MVVQGGNQVGGNVLGGAGVGLVTLQPPGLFRLKGRDSVQQAEQQSNECGRRTEKERRDGEDERVENEQLRNGRGKRGERYHDTKSDGVLGNRGEMKEWSVLRAETVMGWEDPARPRDCRWLGLLKQGTK